MIQPIKLLCLRCPGGKAISNEARCDSDIAFPEPIRWRLLKKKALSCWKRSSVKRLDFNMISSRVKFVNAERLSWSLIAYIGSQIASFKYSKNENNTFEGFPEGTPCENYFVSPLCRSIRGRGGV